MFFVLSQTVIDGITYERNVRQGGFKTEAGMKHAAVKYKPAIVRDEQRTLVGQTVNSQLPKYLA